MLDVAPFRPDRSAMPRNDANICDCPLNARCDECVAMLHAQLGGVAMARGIRWAHRVREQVGNSPAWPAWNESEKVRAIARKKVADISGDERLGRLLERDCYEEAARTWAGLTR